MIFTIDGDRFTGSPEEIVQQLNKSAFVREADSETYRRAFAHRAKLQTGARIDAHDDLTFLREVANLGLATLDENGD